MANKDPSKDLRSRILYHTAHMASARRIALDTGRRLIEHLMQELSYLLGDLKQWSRTKIPEFAATLI